MMGAHGVYTSPDSPGDSPLMQWIAKFRDYRGRGCLIWPFGRNSAGYAIYGRRGKAFYVHRYMCEYAHGPAPKRHQAAHSCGNGDGGCVSPGHVSWKTPSANQHDRSARGRPFTGRLRRRPELIAEIRRSTEPPALVAKRYGMTEANVRHIRAGRTARHLLPSA